MHVDILTEAQRVAQEFGLKIIPCGSDKAPCVSGWRGKATSDPDQIAQLFTGPAQLVGVPAGQDNDLMVFDLDYREGNTPERNAKLQEFENEIRSAYPNGIRIHRTKNGGKHLIMLNPAGRTMPRNVMPKLELVYEGFQFIWPTEGSGYTVEVDVPLDELDEPAARFTKVWEKMPGISSSGGLMSAEMADQVMRTDGEVGTRHEALLRLTQDFVAILKDRGQLAVMTDPQVAEMFEGWFRKEYGPGIEPTRLEELMRWREQDGTVVGSDLGNALRKPLKEARREDRFAELAAKQAEKIGKVKKTAEDLYREKMAGSKSLFDMAAPKADEPVGEFVDIDIEELKTRDLEDIDWIVDGLIPAGNLVSIAGPSGAGKTRFIAALTAALSTGETDKIGLPAATRPIRTLYCANEERAEDLERRVKAAVILNGLTGNLLLQVRGKDRGGVRLARDGVANSEVTEALIKHVRDTGIELVIFDPFVTLGVDEENSAGAVDVVIGEMQRITTETGAAVMFIHHTPKDRNAPEDELRGDPSAWRGSGAIYSSLDLGLTLFPYLPPSCHVQGEGKANRRKLKQAQRDKRVAKYIALDATKERESEPLPTVYYRLEGVEVKPGGRPIGAVTPVSENSARAACDAVLGAMPEASADLGALREWAGDLLQKWPNEGRHDVTLRAMCDHLDKMKPAGWPADEKGTPRKDRGKGKRLIDGLKAGVSVGAAHVYLLEEDQTMILVVAK